MAFTDQLGTVDSKLGNIQLAIGVNGPSGTIFTRTISETLTFIETPVAFVTNLALSSNDELDPEFFLILSGDERDNDAKLVLSGSY